MFPDLFEEYIEVEVYDLRFLVVFVTFSHYALFFTILFDDELSLDEELDEDEDLSLLDRFRPIFRVYIRYLGATRNHPLKTVHFNHF